MNEGLGNETTDIKERRFNPAIESTAKTRLDSFRHGIKDFQKDHPEVLGATIYGSMIKGDQAKETSDVDAFLYIDAEALSPNNKLQDTRVIESKYRSDFLQTLHIPENESSKYYHDLKTKIVSGKILDTAINDYLEYENQYTEYIKMRKEKYTYEASEAEKEKILSQEPKTKTFDIAISGMFHARVGSGIEKYRRLFLEKINALPDKKIAEKIWSDIYMALDTFEKRSDPNKKIYIPSNLHEALRVYHLDLYKNINKNEDNKKIEELKTEINNLPS